MKLVATQPGVTVDDGVAEIGFDLVVLPGVTVGEAPTADEVRVLRESVAQKELCVLGLNASIRVEADALRKVSADDACRVR